LSRRPRPTTPEQEGQDQDGEGAEPETDEEETFIGFPEDEPDEQDSSEPFRRIRQANRELQAEVRKLRQSQPEPKPVEVGPKPALADFDFDEDQYDAAMDGWRATKAAAEKQAQAPDQKVQAAIEGATSQIRDPSGSRSRWRTSIRSLPRPRPVWATI
jgi:hypothetical protein